MSVLPFPGPLFGFPESVSSRFLRLVEAAEAPPALVESCPPLVAAHWSTGSRSVTLFVQPKNGDPATAMAYVLRSWGVTPLEQLEYPKPTAEEMKRHMAWLDAGAAEDAIAASRARSASPSAGDLDAMCSFYKDREDYWSAKLEVCDRGRYRADWDSRIAKVVSERDELEAECAEREGWLVEEDMAHAETARRLDRVTAAAAELLRHTENRPYGGGELGAAIEGMREALADVSKR